MDFYKIQIKVIKEKAKFVRGRFKYHYGITFKNGLFITDGCFAYIIPEVFRVLDVERAFNGQDPFTGVNSFLDEYEDEVIDCNESKTLNNGVTIRWFQNVRTNERIAIDEKICKEFDLTDVSFRGSTAKKPIQIIWRDLIVGVMLPVKVGDNNG